MKKLAFGISVLSACGAFASVELVRNVNMEVVDDDARPIEWAGGPGSWLMDERGNHFLRIVQKEPGKMTAVYRKAEVPSGMVKAVVSFRARITGLVVGTEPWYDARVIINLKGADERVLASHPIYFNEDTPGWVKKSEAFDLPAGTKWFEYMPAVFNCKAGAFDIDDFRITLLGPDETVPSNLPVSPRYDTNPALYRPLAAADTLHRDGNRLRNAKGEEVWLQGLAIPSLEWMVEGDHVRDSFAAAVCDWKANVIRLAVHSSFWFGESKKDEDFNRRSDGGEGYRKLVDELIEFANVRGVYVALDLHEYKAPTEKHAAFWRNAAARYANRPGVLFDILNEPHDISWREWRDGGELKDGSKGSNPAENNEAQDLRSSIGMQKLVDEIRATGAKNMLICGGLDWAYDCRGIMEGFELKDPSGNGIMYSVHVYPWKSNWQEMFLECAKKHPLFLGEVGCWNQKMGFERELKDCYKWAPDILACIQKHRLNWTAWSFHTGASPCVISDWNYTPTPAWGAFVRAALRGARFESDRLR